MTRTSTITSTNAGHHRLTTEHARLLYLISRYSKPAQTEKDESVWIRSLPLRVLMYEGIISGVFDWDYGPASIMLFEGRRFVNISQEGEDDINDLREIKLVDGLKLSTAKHQFITAYQINPKGLARLKRVSRAHRRAVGRLIQCESCGKQIMVEVELGGDCYLICHGCGEKRKSMIMDIEDVSYVSKPYLPKLPAIKLRPEGFR